MRYMLLSPADQQTLLEQLSGMPAFLDEAFGGMSAADARAEGADGFSPVEQCWHLADLEGQGYGVRIRRLLTEENPLLPDFDGARVAEERQYRSLPLGQGLQAFRDARMANVRALRSVPESDWERPGRQDGVGALALCDLPAMMAEHDAGHRAEIQAWIREQGAEKKRT